MIAVILSSILYESKSSFLVHSQSYLADLVPSVFGSLNEHGYFYDPIERGEMCPCTIFLCSINNNLYSHSSIVLLTKVLKKKLKNGTFHDFCFFFRCGNLLYALAVRKSGG